MNCLKDRRKDCSLPCAIKDTHLIWDAVTPTWPTSSMAIQGHTGLHKAQKAMQVWTKLSEFCCLFVFLCVNFTLIEMLTPDTSQNSKYLISWFFIILRMCCSVSPLKYLSYNLEGPVGPWNCSTFKTRFILIVSRSIKFMFVFVVTIMLEPWSK